MMTKEEMRISIALHCGYSEIEEDPLDRMVIPVGPTAFSRKENKRVRLPNYPEDLNAMHNAANTLKEKNATLYEEYIMNIVEHSITTSKCDSIDTPASTRAEHFCRTLWPERWKE